MVLLTVLDVMPKKASLTPEPGSTHIYIWRLVWTCRDKTINVKCPDDSVDKSFSTFAGGAREARTYLLEIQPVP